jgi:hypothetical protein
MEISNLLDITLDDPYSIKIEGPEEVDALSEDFTILYIGNNGEDTDALAHEPKREPED